MFGMILRVPCSQLWVGVLRPNTSSRRGVALITVAALAASMATTGCNSKPDTPPTRAEATAGVAHYPPGMKLGPDGKPVRH